MECRVQYELPKFYYEIKQIAAAHSGFQASWIATAQEQAKDSRVRYWVSGGLLIHAETHGREGLCVAGTNRHLWQNYRKFCELQDDLTKLKKDMQPKKNIASEI